MRPLVIVVDGDAAVRGSLSFLLELDGYDVETLESGEALLKRPPCERTACIVLDQKLPGISGLETLQALRAVDDLTPAILVATHPARAVLDGARRAGAPVVEKPLLGDGLLRDIRRALER